jgi:4-hydroxy-tetrahydrodipicolinate synthase
MVSVVSQVAGEIERELVDAVDRSDLAAARAANARLVPVVEAIMNRMPGAVAAKAALHLQGVLPHASMRGPLLPADATQLRELSAALDAAGLL